MAELIDVFKALVSKSEWSKITDDDKIKNFFIINRYMAKKYHERAQLLNLKTIDKVSALDLLKINLIQIGFGLKEKKLRSQRYQIKITNYYYRILK